MPTLIAINNHTTASLPRPHVLYTVEVSMNGNYATVNRRYSEFIALHDTLKDPYVLPPRRLLITYFLPAAWVDDTLISERKVGLARWLSNLINSAEYRDNPLLLQFLTVSNSSVHVKFNLEDALPSTLSRKVALQLKAELDAEEERSMAATSPSASNEADSTSPSAEAAGPIAASYFTVWSAGQNTPEKIDYSKFDILFFAFVTPNASYGLDWGSNGQDVIRRLVSSAKNSGKGTKVVLSVGGWGGCKFFSAAVASAANRTTFSNALVNAVNNFGLDGVDLDWEYPNSAGAGQPFSPQDSANLLLLVKALRTALGSSKIISAAVPHLPWLGSDGKPLKSVSDFANQMTYVNIMNYDVSGASSTPGPNAPLGNLCGTSSQPQASAQAAVKQWTAAGFPANKLLLGLPTYGYVSRSSKTGLTGSLKPTDDMHLLQKFDDKTNEAGMVFLNGAHPREKTPTRQVEVAAGGLTSWWGQQVPFNEIVKSGALVKGSDGNYKGGAGFTMGWDDCSDTPYLFNVSQETVVAYDDTWSLADKAKFARESGLAGCFTWSLDQDDGLTLQNIIRKNLGK